MTLIAPRGLVGLTMVEVGTNRVEVVDQVTLHLGGVGSLSDENSHLVVLVFLVIVDVAIVLVKWKL